VGESDQLVEVVGASDPNPGVEHVRHAPTVRTSARGVERMRNAVAATSWT
jgi:hypothetical protein